MLTDEEIAALEAAWAPARSAGVLGGTTVPELWKHTAGFASAVCSHFSAPPEDLDVTLIDVGTGAGIPGLLLARQLPRCRITLVDASERRLDHVRRARRVLDLEDRTTIVHGRAEDVASQAATREHFDGAVARLLAEPADAVELLVPLVRDDGVLVVSTASRWRPLWAELPVPGLPTGTAIVEGEDDLFVRIPRRGAVPASLPRRQKTRRRAPFLGG